MTEYPDLNALLNEMRPPAWEEAVAEALKERKFSRYLALHDSQHRADALLVVAELADDDELHLMLCDYWTCTEGWSGKPEMKKKIAALLDRVGYVSDTDEKLSGTQTIFRGNMGENPNEGFCWTLSRAQAEFFARAPFSIRGRLVFGIEPGPDAVPTVWQAFVHTSGIRGYFVDRGEQEVVVYPERLSGIAKIAEAR